MSIHRFLPVVVIVMSLSVLCDGRAWAQLQPLPNQRETPTVADIRIVGNQHVDTETILTQIRTARGQQFSPSQVREDRQAVMDLGLFATVEAETAPSTLGMVVIFKVVENSVIREIVIQGNKAVPSSELMKVITSKVDEVLNTRKLEEDARRVAEFYRRQGYIGQIVDAEINPDTGRLTLTILEAVIEKLTLTFLSKSDQPTDKHETKPKVIWRAIATQEGEVFNARTLGEDMNHLFALNIFDDVRYETKTGSEPGKIIVDIQVKERRTGQAAFGLGFSSRSELVGFVDVSKTNLQGMNRQLGVRAEFGDRKTFEIQYTEPWLDSKQTSLNVIAGDRLFFREPRSIIAFTQRVGESFFEERRKGVRLTLARPLRNRTTSVFVIARNEEVSLERTDLNTFVRDLQSFGRVAAIGVGVIKDTRHNIFDPRLGRLNPTSGSFIRLQLEAAGVLLGGDSSFRRMDFEVRRYRPLGKKTVLAARFMMGRAFGSLPAFEQFFLGGSETLRGYNIDHEFGDNQVLLNVELRRNIQISRDPRQNFQVVLFLDWGDAWGGNFANGNSFDPILGFGVGLRVGTPIGPIRLDIGMGSEGARTHFSIGPLF